MPLYAGRAHLAYSHLLNQYYQSASRINKPRFCCKKIQICPTQLVTEKPLKLYKKIRATFSRDRDLEAKKKYGTGALELSASLTPDIITEGRRWGWGEVGSHPLERKTRAS